VKYMLKLQNAFFRKVRMPLKILIGLFRI
jgi:hypothetical protein